MFNSISAASPSYRTMERAISQPTDAGSGILTAGNPLEAAARGTVPAAGQTEQSDAHKMDLAKKNDRGKERSSDRYDCQTCDSRKYVDGSSDPGVSFKTPTALSPEKAATAVRAHEYEHVNRERASAHREGRKVVSQSVTYQSAICPECGSVYTSGGTTRTVTKNQVEKTYGLEKEEKGVHLNLTA